MKRSIILVIGFYALSIFGGVLLASELQRPLYIFDFFGSVLLIFVCVCICALFLLPVLNKLLQ